MQTVPNQTTRPLQKLSIFLAEGVQFFTLGIEHSKDVPVLVRHGNNDLRPCRVKSRQIARIVMHVTDDDGFPGFERRPAQTLCDWKTRIGRWLVARSGENRELLVHDLVNADPAITARRSNHLHKLLHPLWSAPAGERECPDLLQLLAGRFFHSRESNLVQNKTSASGISSFCD